MSFIMPIYSAKNLRFSYDSVTNVLNGIDLNIFCGEFVGLVGPSGSGKSTLLNLLGLLESPQNGSLKFLGQQIGSGNNANFHKIRRNDIGFVFQDFQLIDVLTSQENVEYFLHRQKVPKKERKKIVKECLEKVGLWSYRNSYPYELSGGQKQRVAIARALAKRPSVIIADEPTAGLDATTSRMIMATLKELNRTTNTTVVVATHDPIALQYVSKVIRLEDGVIATELTEVACVS